MPAGSAASQHGSGGLSAAWLAPQGLVAAAAGAAAGGAAAAAQQPAALSQASMPSWLASDSGHRPAVVGGAQASAEVRRRRPAAEAWPAAQGSSFCVALQQSSAPNQAPRKSGSLILSVNLQRQRLQGGVAMQKHKTTNNFTPNLCSPVVFISSSSDCRATFSASRAANCRLSRSVCSFFLREWHMGGQDNGTHMSLRATGSTGRQHGEAEMATEAAFPEAFPEWRSTSRHMKRCTGRWLNVKRCSWQKIEEAHL